jgi:hypothetical protein
MPWGAQKDDKDDKDSKDKEGSKRQNDSDSGRISGVRLTA